MPSYSVVINDISQDENFFVWGSGQDLRKFTGTSWEYYNFTNSAVPNSFPYFLDTRCVDVDPEGFGALEDIKQVNTVGKKQNLKVITFYADWITMITGEAIT